MLLLLATAGALPAQTRAASPAGADPGLLGAAHVVRLDSATIAASPARTLAELLAGRVPGLNVTWASGDAGLAPEVSIRGSATMFGPGRPLLYVDGVLQREDRHILGPALDRQRPSHTWSLPADGIAEVEVLLGPAAGALLPFGAARGAVLVRTRRAAQGAWRTSATLEATHQAAVAPFRTRVTQAGDVTGGGTTDYCPRTDVVTGYCTVTAERTFVPFGGRSPFDASTGLRAALDASGDLRLATVRAAIVRDRSTRFTAADGFDRLDLALGAATREWRGLTATLDARYARSTGTYAPWGENGIYQTGVAATQPTDSTVPLAVRNVDTLLARALPYAAERIGGGLALRWAPRPWLSAWAEGSTERATRGSDITVNFYDAIAVGGTFLGSERDLTSYRHGMGAASVGVRATRALPLGMRVSGTVAVHRTHYDQQEQVVNQVRLSGGGGSTGGQAIAPDVRSTSHVVLVRLDAGRARWIAGGFRKEATQLLGLTYGDDPFNQLQAGWTLTDEPWMPRLPGVSRLALRGAYGESGDHEAVIGAARVALPTVGGRVRARLQRTLEREGGADLALAGGRLLLSGTVFTRALRDGYLATNSGLPGDAIDFGSWVTHGHEWTLTLPARPVGAITVDAALGWSSARTRITKWRPTATTTTLSGLSRVTFEDGARFATLLAARYYYSDANADGVIDASEITIGAPAAAGVTTPTDLLALTVQLGWRGRVQVGATLDGKSGHQRYDATGRLACLVLVCPGLYGGTLDEQARAVTSGYTTTFTGPLTAGDFIRARAAWVRVGLGGMLHGLPDAAVTLTLRNAVLWRRAGRGDPETGTFAFATVQRGNYLVPGLAPQVSLRLDLAR
ncbi:MAG: TonB-dependent receptor plug domain-containing protein [Gemmatimonadaceae bacterium]|nr:TonB-dependent receptor plug domain-containing protein [Gemmatimonadaceae bacterium]